MVKRFVEDYLSYIKWNADCIDHADGKDFSTIEGYMSRENLRNPLNQRSVPIL